MRLGKLLLALFLTIAPMSALAREVTDSSITSAAPEFADAEAAAILREIKIFVSVPIFIRDVILIVEKRAAGAKAVDISFDGRSDRIAFRAKTYQRDEICTGVVDASTGTIVGDGVVTPVSGLDLKDRAALIGLRTAGIDLSEAAQIAERHGSGKAVSAGLEDVNGSVSFLVVVVAEGSLKQVSVNPCKTPNQPTARDGKSGGSHCSESAIPLQLPRRRPPTLQRSMTERTRQRKPSGCTQHSQQCSNRVNQEDRSRT